MVGKSRLPEERTESYTGKERYYNHRGVRRGQYGAKLPMYYRIVAILDGFPANRLQLVLPRCCQAVVGRTVRFAARMRLAIATFVRSTFAQVTTSSPMTEARIGNARRLVRPMLLCIGIVWARRCEVRNAKAHVSAKRPRADCCIPKEASDLPKAGVYTGGFESDLKQRLAYY